MSELISCENANIFSFSLLGLLFVVWAFRVLSRCSKPGAGDARDALDAAKGALLGKDLRFDEDDSEDDNGLLPLPGLGNGGDVNANDA